MEEKQEAQEGGGVARRVKMNAERRSLLQRTNAIRAEREGLRRVVWPDMTRRARLGGAVPQNSAQE